MNRKLVSCSQLQIYYKKVITSPLGRAKFIRRVHFLSSLGTLEFSDTHSDMSYVFINDSSQTNVPLLQACIDGDLPFAKRLLETGCDPNIRDNRGRTGLHLAAARGNVDICRLLHKFGADLLATDYQGNTALHLCGHVDTIQFLVSNGLKIDIWLVSVRVCKCIYSSAMLKSFI